MRKKRYPVLKIIFYIFFAALLIITAVYSVIDMRSEYLLAYESGEGIELALLPIVAVFWGVIIISEISLFISIAFILRDFCAQRWFLAVYYIVLAQLSLVALYLMVLYRYGNISNKGSDIALIALAAAIIMHIAGAIVRIVNWCKKIT
ncbi:MAG: hypothetical protein IJ404_01670 [Clostridia bacterium]|nr:hypothetical protein [Clostridia bacterium]